MEHLSVSTSEVLNVTDDHQVSLPESSQLSVSMRSSAFNSCHGSNLPEIQTDEEAMVAAGAIRILNNSQTPHTIRAYHGTDMLCLCSYSMLEVPRGTEVLCQACPDDGGTIQVYMNGAYHSCQVGMLYQITSANTLILYLDSTVGLSGERHAQECGLTSSEYECADSMLNLCRQYLNLVAKGLRDKLPPLVFSDIVPKPAVLETRLKALLRDEQSSIMAMMCQEAPEVSERRNKLKARLEALDNIAALLRSSDL